MDFATAFRAGTMRSGNPAVYFLREQFESLAGTPHKVDTCEWIARSFYQLQQFSEAGNWFEAAGDLLRANGALRPELRALAALEEYEKALESYEQAGDDDAADGCFAVVAKLRRACAPA